MSDPIDPLPLDTYATPLKHTEVHVSVSEFLALKTLLMALLATVAAQQKAAGGDGTGVLVAIEEAAANSLRSTQVLAGDDHAIESLKREAIDHVRTIIGHVSFE